MSKKFRVCYSKEKLGKKISRFCLENSIHAKKKEQKIQVNSKDVTKKGPTVLLGKQI